MTDLQGVPWRWDNVEQRWRRMSGKFTRITAAEGNHPWAISAEGIVHRYNGLWWENKETDVADVAADANGNIYIAKRDGRIRKWYPLRSEWRPIEGSARRIALDSSGQPWIITVQGNIQSFDGKAWKSMPGQALDIALGKDNVAMIVDATGQALRWNGIQQRWDVLPGVKALKTLAVTTDGSAWVVLQDGTIFTNGTLTATPLSEDDTATIPAAPIPIAPVAKAPVEVASVPTPTTPTAAPVVANNTNTAQAPESAYSSDGSSDPATITTKDKITFVNTRKMAMTLAIGAEGSVFALNVGGGISRWSNTNKTLESFPGDLVRIAVHPDGNPWGISALGRVFRHTGSRWEQIPNATASDISIGYDGTVLTTSAEGRLYKLNSAGNIFQSIPGRGSLVAAGPDGTPWVIRSDKLIQRCDVSPCKVYRRKAKSIAIGPDGSVWIVSDTNRLMRLVKNDQFETLIIPGHTPKKVAVGPMGYPWVVSSTNTVLASTYFDRDELQDRSVAVSTSASGTTGTGETAFVASTGASGFTFSKNMRFATVPYTSLNSGNCPLLVSDASGVIWAHSPGSMLEVYDAKRKKFIPKNTGFDSEMLHAFGIVPNGDIWALMEYGQSLRLYRDRNGILKEYDISGADDYEDLTVGPDGTVYVSASLDGLRFLYTKAPNSENFKKMSSYQGVRLVDVGLGGDIWITDINRYLRRWNGSTFEKPTNSTLKSEAISISKVNGTLYAIEFNTGLLYKWNASNKSFDKVNNVFLSNLSVDGSGRPWICRDTTPVIERARD